jgi:ferritin-like metal-binding protein YciE
MPANAPSMPMQSPLDLFVHELSEIQSAEQTIATMLETAIGVASRPDIRQALAHHLQETRQQIGTLERIFRQFGAQPHPIVCRAATGLLASLQEALAAEPSTIVTDALILDAASKTEYFEVACYNALVQRTRAGGMTEIAALLQQHLEQENAARQTVDTIILEQAIELGGLIDPNTAMDSAAESM